MATRLYATCRSPGTRLYGGLQGDWSPGESDRDNRGLRRFVFLMAQTKTDGGVQRLTLGGEPTLGSSAPNQKILAANLQGTAIWVTDKLLAGVTLSGTLTITLMVACGDTGAGASGKYHVNAYITTGDTLTPRASLLNNSTGAVAWSLGPTWRSETFTLSGAAALAGDRIALEIGGLVTPATGADNICSIGWGTTDASDVPLADATDGSSAVAAAWIEFSDALTFAAAPAAPANSSCATAVVISALPFNTGPIDSTTSTDTDRSVWWTWTASVTQRVFITGWGGNYWTKLQVWTGGCGGLTQAGIVGNKTNTRVPWVGTSQAACWIDAQAGTSYWFQLSSDRVTSGTNAAFGAKNSGGAAYLNLWPYSAPLKDDLFVSCQHVVAYRAGVPVNVLSDFYGNTPTNSCIDYTLRSLTDLNGGTSTALRLYLDLFGSGPDVEILDLATLNVGQSEIDFIINPLNYTNHSQNLASIVMDKNGRIVTGYFGDAYSVIGQISTPNACRINRIDATHADDQPGAPFANAEAFTVTQDVGGSCYVELVANGDIAYYTSSGRKILRFNLDTNTQLADFTTLPVQGAEAPRPGARGLRLLPPYDGTGGLLVTYGNVVHRLNGAGAIAQTYTPSDTVNAKDLDKVELTSDASAFWVSDQYSTQLFKFDLAAGTQLATIVTNLPPGQLCGFTVYGYRGGSVPLGQPQTYTYVRRRLRRAPHISDEQMWVFYSRFQLDIEAGATREVDAPFQFDLRWSDDGGHTWSNVHRIVADPIGVTRFRALWRRLGRSRDRVFEVVDVNPGKSVLLDAYLQLGKGIS